MATTASKALIGSLVSEMENENFVTRVTRGAQKRPEARMDEDIDAILSVTQELPLMKHCGPEVQRDLCYAFRLGSYEDGDAISTPADLRGEGSLFLVLSGFLQVKTRDNVPFGSMLWRGHDAHGNEGQQRHSRADMPTPLAGSPPPRESLHMTAVTPQEMRSVFSSLDLDNNGSLSIDELQIALESFGMPTGYEEVKEMVLKVDADSDGTIDFDEFKAVIQAMMAKRKQMSEEMLGTGKWEHDESGFTRIFGMGGSFGENSIMYSMPLAAEMVAMGKTEVLRLDSKDYIGVLEGGGNDGNLDAKVEALSSNVLLEKYARKTDKKALAMAMKTESVRVQSTLYKQGAPAETLYIIVSGQANVVSAPEGDRDGQDKSPSPLRGKSSTLKGRSGPSRSKSTNAPKLEIAIVGAGDICGEAVLLDQPTYSTGVVASSNLEVLSIKKKDALRLLADRDLKELQEYVREREAAREARMQTSQENMKTATSKMMRTHQKASNEEALAGDLANAYGIPSRFLPGEAEGALMSRSMSGIANIEASGSTSTVAPNPKAAAWWDPAIVDSSSPFDDPPQAATSGQSAGLPEGSEELIKSMRNLNPAGIRSLKGVQYNSNEEFFRVLQLEAVDQEIEQQPKLTREKSIAKSSALPVSGRASPSPPRIWFQSSGSPSLTAATRDSAPLKQRISSEDERQKPLEHRASQSMSMGKDSDWWVQASIRRNMNLESSMFAEGQGEEQDPFVRFTTNMHEKVAAAAAAADAKRRVADAVPPESLPPELLVVESKGGGVPLPVNKLKPHVLLKSKVTGDKIYTPSAMRAAPLAVPPLVHSPFHPYPRVSPGASPDASRASSPRPLSPPRFSPVPADRYTMPRHSRAGDASPTRSISPEGMAVDITRSHEIKSRQGSPFFSPKSSRCPSPDRLLADAERKALASREKHEYLHGLSKMLNALPREVGATFPVYHVTEKEPRLPYGFNYIRKQKNKAKALAKRGFSPPAGVTRRRQGQLTDGLHQGKQDVAALEQRKLMLELLMDRSESDRVRYFKLQKDVNGLRAQITNARAHNEAAAATGPAVGKWTTAGARRLAMKKKI